MPIEFNKEYIHHTDIGKAASVREMVFGMEDGMVSTLGSITGIASAMGNHFTVILSGLVIVAVESVSMAVGSYLSSKSEKSVNDRKLFEEDVELRKFPEEEKEELRDMYIEDGWSKNLAEAMTKEASQNHDLFLKEMAYRELKVFPEHPENPLKNSLVMFFSYLAGGSIPLVPYFFLSLNLAILVSIIVTLGGLFGLGAYTTKFNKGVWWKYGLEMMGLASLAAIIGYGVGKTVDIFWLNKG